MVKKPFSAAAAIVSNATGTFAAQALTDIRARESRRSKQAMTARRAGSRLLLAYKELPSARVHSVADKADTLFEPAGVSFSTRRASRMSKAYQQIDFDFGTSAA
jgi:hypothetical protein